MTKLAMLKQLARFLTAVLVACTVTYTSTAIAQSSYPARPVRVIVPYAAGSATDLTARRIIAALSESMGQPFFVENIVGAVGIVGTERLVRSPGDGYTLAVTSSLHAILPALHSLSFDAVKDIAPVALIGTSAMVLVVNPKFPAQNVRELIEMAKAKPEFVTFGSTGNGSVGHIAIEMLAGRSGAKFLHVPYKANAGLSTDLLGGQINAGFLGAAAAVQLIKSGQLRALGVSTPTRSVALADVPTLIESGIRGYDIDIWTMLIAPASTPPAVVARLREEAERAMNQRSVMDYLREQSVGVPRLSPAALGELLTRDIAKYSQIVRDAGIKNE